MTVPMPKDIHAKTRLQHILGKHCRDEDMGLPDQEFIREVLTRYEKDCAPTPLDQKD